MASKIKKINPWKNIILFSFTTRPLFSTYYFLTTYKDVQIIEIFLKGFTNTGYLLIGFSLLIGSLAKFWNYFDTYLHYRKKLGIIGFFYILLHGFVGTLIYVFPNPLILWDNFWAVFYGILGLVLFFICYCISEIVVIRLLGPKLWRRLIRYISYTAFIFGTIHLFLAKYVVWQEYIMSDRIFPPISLPLFVFGISILILRFYVFLFDTFHLGKDTVQGIISKNS